MSRLTPRSAPAALPATGLFAAPAAQAAPAEGPRPAAPSGGDPVRLAFLADTHAAPENEESMARLRAVLDAIAGCDPTLVSHGGDVTAHGTAQEYDAFNSAAPAALRDRIA